MPSVVVGEGADGVGYLGGVGDGKFEVLVLMLPPLLYQSVDVISAPVWLLCPSFGILCRHMRVVDYPRRESGVPGGEPRRDSCKSSCRSRAEWHPYLSSNPAINSIVARIISFTSAGVWSPSSTR